MSHIRMLEDAEGSPNGHTVYRYEAGQVYSHESTPHVDPFLAESFVASGRAVAVDAAGNPIGTAASRRSRKSTADSEPAEDTGEADDRTEAEAAATFSDAPEEAIAEEAIAEEGDDAPGSSRRRR